MFALMAAVPAGAVLTIRRLPVLMPRQRGSGTVDQQQADDPQHRDDDRNRGESSQMSVSGSWLPATTRPSTTTTRSASITKTSDAARYVSGWRRRTPERIQRDQHHGLDSDAAENVAHRDVKVPGQRGATGGGGSK